MATLTTPATQWPRISVITPSYNQAQFLERTLLSVLDQKYPALEYIVIDGGSNDASKEIIARSDNRLAFSISEKDSGQSNAINKGLARTTGEILCWLNSDDFYPPGTLEFVGRHFADHPNVDVICGHTQAVDVAGKPLDFWRGAFDGRRQLAEYWHGYSMHQPSIFWRRRVYEAIGLLDENMHLTMDYDYWLRMADRGFNIASVDRILACATVHPDQKTNDGFVGYKRAQLRIALRRFGSPFAFRDWDIRLSLYWHLLKTSIKLLIRRPTLYTR